MQKTDKGQENVENTSLIYEVGYHVVPTLSTEEMSQAVSHLKSEIERLGGKFLSEEPAQKMHLAYEMVDVKKGKGGKYSESYFGWIKFEANAETAEKVEELFKHDENIFRFLLVKTVLEDVIYHKQEEEEFEPSVDGTDDEESDSNEEEPSNEVDEKELDETIDRITA